MRKLSVLLAVASLSTVSFAQTLRPASGVYYPDDANNSGIVRVEFTDAVDNPTAVIEYNGKEVDASMYQQGNTGRFWAVQVEEALKSDLTTNGTQIVLTVKGGDESVTGTYTYMPIFPLTGISPENYTDLSSKTETVTFSFNQTVTCDSIVVRSGDVVNTLDGVSNSTISVELKESYWATITGVDNSITVTLMGTTADGTYINNIADGEGIISATYAYKETIELPTFLGVDQDPYWWLAQDLFGMDVEFDFNGPVNYENAVATITFYEDGDTIPGSTVVVLASEMVTGQNWRTGNYYLSVPIPDLSEEFYDDDTDEWQFTQMTVTLTGVSALGLTDPYSVTYDTEFADDDFMLAPQRVNIAASSITTVDTTELVDVYDINGNLIKTQLSINDVNSLGRGLYIINGKKLLVK